MDYGFWLVFIDYFKQAIVIEDIAFL